MNEAKHCCPTYHVELGAQVCAKRYRNANADYRQGQGFRPGHDDFACRDCKIGRRLYEAGLAKEPKKERT